MSIRTKVKPVCVMIPLVAAGCVDSTTTANLSETASSAGDSIVEVGSSIGSTLSEWGSSAVEAASGLAGVSRDVLCSPDYYAGRNVAGIVSITASFLKDANQNYVEGLEKAVVAVEGRNDFASQLRQDASKIAGQGYVAGAFDNSTVYAEYSSQTQSIIDQIEERELDDATLAALGEANQSLYLANYYQFQAGIGIYKIYNEINNVDSKDDLARFLARNGVNESFQAALQTSDALRDLVGSMRSGTQLYFAVSDATDFNADTATLEELGITVDITNTVAKAQSRADSFQAQSSNQLNYEPKGDNISAFYADNPWAEDLQQKDGAAYLVITSTLASITKAMLCPSDDSPAS